MKLVNLTPHEINILIEGGRVAVPPSGDVARVETLHVACDAVEVDGDVIPVSETRFTDVKGLPAPEAGVGFIVSRLVLDRVKSDRPDVFAPGELVRDASGQPIGCRGLSR